MRQSRDSTVCQRCNAADAVVEVVTVHGRGGGSTRARFCESCATALGISGAANPARVPPPPESK
jgi:hypothetical protein